MFLGTYTPKMDQKGRITLPVKFRQADTSSFVITKGQDRCLAVYPREIFTRYASKISALPKSDPQVRAFVRAFSAGADEQVPDTQGRINLSADHLKYANLIKECVVIGAIDYFEVWDLNYWQTYQQDHEEAYSIASGIPTGVDI